jgi:hypothetical protein
MHCLHMECQALLGHVGSVRQSNVGDHPDDPVHGHAPCHKQFESLGSMTLVISLSFWSIANCHGLFTRMEGQTRAKPKPKAVVGRTTNNHASNHTPKIYSSLSRLQESRSQLPLIPSLPATEAIHLKSTPSHPICWSYLPTCLCSLQTWSTSINACSSPSIRRLSNKWWRRIS